MENKISNEQQYYNVNTLLKNKSSPKNSPKNESVPFPELITKSLNREKYDLQSFKKLKQENTHKQPPYYANYRTLQQKASLDSFKLQNTNKQIEQNNVKSPWIQSLQKSQENLLQQNTKNEFLHNADRLRVQSQQSSRFQQKQKPDNTNIRAVSSQTSRRNNKQKQFYQIYSQKDDSFSNKGPKQPETNLQDIKEDKQISKATSQIQMIFIKEKLKKSFRLCHNLLELVDQIEHEVKQYNKTYKVDSNKNQVITQMMKKNVENMEKRLQTIESDIKKNNIKSEEKQIVAQIEPNNNNIIIQDNQNDQNGEIFQQSKNVNSIQGNAINENENSNKKKLSKNINNYQVRSIYKFQQTNSSQFKDINDHQLQNKCDEQEIKIQNLKEQIEGILQIQNAFSYENGDLKKKLDKQQLINQQFQKEQNILQNKLKESQLIIEKLQLSQIQNNNESKQ